MEGQNGKIMKSAISWVHVAMPLAVCFYLSFGRLSFPAPFWIFFLSFRLAHMKCKTFNQSKIRNYLCITVFALMHPNCIRNGLPSKYCDALNNCLQNIILHFKLINPKVKKVQETIFWRKQRP